MQAGQVHKQPISLLHGVCLLGGVGVGARSANLTFEFCLVWVSVSV